MSNIGEALINGEGGKFYIYYKKNKGRVELFSELIKGGGAQYDKEVKYFAASESSIL